MKTIAESLAEFAFDMTSDPIPAFVRRRAAHPILDGAGFGLYATHLGTDLTKWDLGAAVRDLGTEWETAQVATEPFPTCQLNISCIDAAIAQACKHSIKLANALSAGSMT